MPRSLSRLFVRVLISGSVLPSAMASTRMYAQSNATASSVTLLPCDVAGLAPPTRCGTIAAPEDRSKASGRMLSIFVVVAQATDSTRPSAPDPLFLFAGGPGQGASTMGPFATDAFGLVRRRRAIVLVDARGTGRSSPLNCALTRSVADIGGPFYPLASVRFCRDSLSRVADLTRYTTENIVADIDAVRGALGFERINIYGTSYGSRLALAYLRRHANRVRSVVLKAVAPPTLIAPMNYAVDLDRALGLLARDCAAEAACHAAFPDPLADARAAIVRADRGELKAAVSLAPGRTDTVQLSSSIVQTVVAGLLQNAHARAQLPMVLHLAASGDPTSLVQQVAQYRRVLDAQLSIGMHLGVSCSEDASRLDLPRAERDDAGTWLGASRVRSLIEACRNWITGDVSPDQFTAVRATTPVLLVSGELDPNLPPRWGEEAARTLPNARHVVLRGVAHGWSDIDRCGAQFVADFIERASVKELDLRCARTGVAPSFVVPPPR